MAEFTRPARLLDGIPQGHLGGSCGKCSREAPKSCHLVALGDIREPAGATARRAEGAVARVPPRG